MTQNDLLFGYICHRQQPATSKFVLLVLVSLSIQPISSDYVAQSISNYLTSETGIMIVFESAIVPKWKDSRISFKNVYVARRSPAAVSHPSDDNNHDEEGKTILDPSDPYANVTTFDLMVDSIDVTLSLWQWLDGKGLIKDAAVKGVRGVIGKYSLSSCSYHMLRGFLDRRHLKLDPDQVWNPADFRHPHRVGDFELESLQLDDFLVTIYQPGGFRPFRVSVFRADLHRLRKQWLLYDLLCADNIVGQFDNCLFSLHKPQSMGRSTEMDAHEGEGTRLVGSICSCVFKCTYFYISHVFVSMVSVLTTYSALQQWRGRSPGSSLERSTLFLISRFRPILKTVCHSMPFWKRLRMLFQPPCPMSLILPLNGYPACENWRNRRL
jgi:hypothetical protein